MIKLSLSQPRNVVRSLGRGRAIMNLLLNQFQKTLRMTKMNGVPCYLTLETGNICNLQCVLCPTGQKRRELSKGFLQFETFQKIVDSFAKHLMFLEFYNWGEPFLNPDLLKMIRYARNRNIFVIVSSNMNFRDLSFDQAKEIVESGLNQLLVFCAGASDNTIKRYQKGATFTRAYANMQAIQSAKKFLKRNTPFVQWRLLMTRHTELELEHAKVMSRTCCDYLTPLPIHCDMAKEVFLNPEERFQNVEHWLPANEALCDYDKINRIEKKMRNSCSYLWSKITVHWNGDCFPCCKLFNDSFTFGNLLSSSPNTVWNSLKYQTARKIALGKKFDDNTVICSVCSENKAMT